MQRLKLAVAVVVLGCGLARAYEIDDNPERLISVGLNYSGSFLRGNEYSTFVGVPNFVLKDYDLTSQSNQGMIDIRVPVSPNLTLSAGGGILFTQYNTTQTGNNTATQQQHGPVVTAGLRWYIQ